MWSRVDTRIWRWLFWSVWCVCTWLFLQPASELPPIIVWDKAAHAFVFLVLMSLLWPAYRHHARPLVLAGLLVLYGVLIECAQAFIPDRSFSLLDAVADAVGVVPMLLWAMRKTHA